MEYGVLVSSSQPSFLYRLTLVVTPLESPEPQAHPSHTSKPSGQSVLQGGTQFVSKISAF